MLGDEQLAPSGVVEPLLPREYAIKQEPTIVIDVEHGEVEAAGEFSQTAEEAEEAMEEDTGLVGLTQPSEKHDDLTEDSLGAVGDDIYFGGHQTPLAEPEESSVGSSSGSFITVIPYRVRNQRVNAAGSLLVSNKKGEVKSLKTMSLQQLQTHVAGQTRPSQIQERVKRVRRAPAMKSLKRHKPADGAASSSAVMDVSEDDHSPLSDNSNVDANNANVALNTYPITELDAYSTPSHRRIRVRPHYQKSEPSPGPRKCP